jgi:SRSO17 transposase
MRLCQEDNPMTTIELRATVDRLLEFHGRFAGWFGRSEAREHSRAYVLGLLAPGRKSVEPLALRGVSEEPRDQGRVLAMQRFLTNSPWNGDEVQREIQAVFAEELAPSAHGEALGIVGVIDESSFPKHGQESVGVARQHCGRLGKVDNCQVGVYLIGVAPAGVALLEHRLHLNQPWIDDAQRRAKTHIPAEVEHQTKPEIAADLFRRVRDNGKVRFDWVTADDLYGRNGDLLASLESAGQRYVMETPSNTRFWITDPASFGQDFTQHRPTKRIERLAMRTAKRLFAELPAEAWQPICLRKGAAGPLVYEFARVRVWAVRDRKAGPPVWAICRRSPQQPAERTYWVSNANEKTPLETLAGVAGTRWRVEEFFEDAKGHLGMADYEARGWTSWHHHMTLVALAHLYVTLARKDLRKTVPELTLDMAVRLLASALPLPKLTEQDALEIVQYHLDRNRVAKNSHHKSWLARNHDLAKQVML